MFTRTVIAVALLATPAAMAAQTPEERIQAATSQAQTHGIPLSLIESKIAEGRAKGVPMDRIAAAIEKRAEGLRRAHDALSRGDERPTEAELAVGADAIGAGVSEAVLAEIAATAPQDRRTVAIAALTQLVAAGEAPAHALEQVTAALARGPDALANLPAQAAAARARRGPPEGVGRPGGPGAQGRTPPAGPPAGVPAPGQRPGSAGPPERPGQQPGIPSSGGPPQGN